MGPAVLLVPASLFLCFVASTLSLVRMILGPPAKWTWIFAGTVTLLAATFVVSDVEAEHFLDHIGNHDETCNGPLIWSIVNEIGGVSTSTRYSGQSLGALAVACWGLFLMLRGIVQGTPMTMRRALLAVLGSTATFVLVGPAIGFALGSLAPNYYRDLYEGGHSPKFDPVAMGIGLGVTQGAAGGALIGLALVWIMSRQKTLKASHTKDKIK